ncbi:MAG: hypothetical protein PUB32_09340 [Clostridiales bacterium]|nr:hypothetical protein [Clostridiales bacterium]
METLRSWIIGLCAGALICGIVQAVAPKTSSGNAVRLACGFMTVALLIGPLKSFDFEEYALRLGEIRARGGEYASQAISGGEEQIKAVIEDSCEAYILDKAAELGIMDATAAVSAKITDGGNYPYPYSVELGGEAEGEQKKRLSSYIEGELGVPAERQHWSGEDEN